MLRILGVMTGTSCDGLDAACLEFGGSPGKGVAGGDWKPLWAESAPYPPRLRERVLRSQKPGTRMTSAEWLALDRDLGQWYARAIGAIVSKAGREVHVIANHGQTVAHWPRERGGGVTWQLGAPAAIAQATGLTVISDFRRGDMVVGGQGAPLTPRYHAEIARKLAPGEGTAFHNIGGISNLTYCPPPGPGGEDNGELLAFDTGPGNAWMDEATARATRGKLKFDRGGELAAKGEPDERAVGKLLAGKYFRRPPPKSTGRDDFPFEALARATRARGADLVATATLVTARSIAGAYRRFVLGAGLPLSRIWVCGGGARNPTLLDWVRRELSAEDSGRGVALQPLAQDPWRPEWIEAQAFAFLGWLTLRGRPVGGTWTGAREASPPGQILPGRNWATVLSRL